MQRKHLFILVGSIVLTVCVASILARAAEPAAEPSATPSRLAVVWTSGDPDVAHRVCLMYTGAAAKNKWFGEVRLIVWGPSARLLAADKDLQAKIKTMMKDGVIVQACIACADSYGVTETLRGLGIEVKGMGRPLTDMLQSDYKVLTF
jgi:hypothetical protein